MNFLKSIFISSFMMLNMFLGLIAPWMILMRGGSLLAWSGVILTSVPVISVLGWLMITKSVARTSSNFPVLQILGAVGIALSGLSWLRNETGVLPLLLSLTGFGALLVYVYWYSRLSRRKSEAIEAGKRLPKFSLKNADGTTISSEDLTSKPTILMFYRGNWCPLCMAQIKELAGRYRDLEDAGVRVALISPQPHENTAELAKKFNVNFDFLTDEGNRAARLLGINSENGIPLGMQMMGYDSETVLPTVIITDASGKIIWTHETDNYRVRPEPEVFLEILRNHRIVAEV